jgi:hypothetical protein
MIVETIRDMSRVLAARRRRRLAITHDTSSGPGADAGKPSSREM